MITFWTLLFATIGGAVLGFIAGHKRGWDAYDHSIEPARLALKDAMKTAEDLLEQVRKARVDKSA